LPVSNEAVSGRTKHSSAPRSPSKVTQNLLAAILFLAPAILLMFLFRLVPIATVAWDSFRSSAGQWVGLENFVFLLGSPSFRDSLSATLIFNLIVNPIQIALAFLLALAIVDGARRPGLWQSLNLMPVAVPLAVSAIVWGVAMRPDSGILNSLLAAVGLPNQAWLTSPEQALWSIVLIASWVGVGYWALFLVAGLHQVDHSLLEAAKIDGAGYLRTLFSIRIPLIRGTLGFVLVADTVVNLLLFAPVQMLTRGGPEGSTSFVMFDIYRNAFVFRDLPLAAAETFLLVLIVTAIVALQFRFMKPEGAKK